MLPLVSETRPPATEDPDVDPDTLHRLRAADEQALGTVLDRFRERLTRVIRLRMDPRLNGRVDAEDVLQDTFFAAAQRLQHFAKNDASTFVWLRGIAMQTLVDVTRHHLHAAKRGVGAERKIAGPGPDATAAHLADQLFGAQTTPTRAAVRAEMIERLQLVLEELSETDREILVLRHFEELTNNQAAEVLGLHKAASTNRYVRALRRLRAALDGVPGFEPDA